MKIAFRKMYSTICGIFGSNKGGVAGYADRIWNFPLIGQIDRKVGDADCGNEFSNTLQGQKVMSACKNRLLYPGSVIIQDTKACSAAALLIILSPAADKEPDQGECHPC